MFLLYALLGLFVLNEPALYDYVEYRNDKRPFQEGATSGKGLARYPC